LPVTIPETIVRRRCAALIPYARNARTHSDQQVAQIAASICEKDKLLVSVAPLVAERRLKRGVKLNYPEAVALITDYVLEGAR
jgi:hypothetical protein